jgi:hypothetical protein
VISASRISSVRSSLLALALAANVASAGPQTGLALPFDADPLASSKRTVVVGPESARRALYLASATSTDWRQVIDQKWGASPYDTTQMLALFDAFWNATDQDFACFQGLDVDWSALRSRYRAEIQSGVSQGRLTAIMNHLALALRTSGTQIQSSVDNSPLDPGTPLFVVGGWGDNSHFGAGLTPLPDSTLLVYKTIPNHPLGLVPGDIVLGYDGVPWKQLYRDLLSAELPLAAGPQLMGWWWGSSSSSWTHSMLMSAGLNWHLFSTIDVKKYSSGQTLHLSVSPLVGLNQTLDCTEQLPVAGVPMPDYLGAGDNVSWGLINGTQIGYVYVRAWTGNAGTQFFNAVDSLLTQHQTTGLIFDFRTNYGGAAGGGLSLAYAGLGRLFGEDFFTIAFGVRCNTTDHLAMCPDPTGKPAFYIIRGTAATDYDHPIAVLVGPGAITSGATIADWFRYHPRARFFGQSTSASVNALVGLSLPLAGWSAQYAQADPYRVGAPGDYLTHDEFPVDQPVWLTPDDVARGSDTVVNAAVAWMTSATAGADGVAPGAGLQQVTPNPFRRTTRFRFGLSVAGAAKLEVFDLAGRRVRVLLDERSLTAGTHDVTWDGRDGTGHLVPAGVYLCRFESGGRSEARTILRSR